MLGNISTVLQMDMENIFGQMAVFTKEILSMEFGMAMEFGSTKKKQRCIQDVTVWIRKKDMGCMSGSASSYIRVNSDKILEKDMES